MEPIFNPPKSITALNLKMLFQGVLGNIEPILKLPQEMIKKTVSIQEKINEIREIILKKSSLSFGALLSKAESKTEIIVTFLAILELVKNQSVQVLQKNIFDDICIEKSSQESIINN